ncbi:MAG TPA: hypothetical protein VF662_14080 [Allosphingosinicella sp.]|jgi:hypothetical protein
MAKLIGLAGLGLALALVGCGDGGGASEPRTKTMTVSSPFIEQLKGLSKDNQGLALRRAVQDSQQRCKRVEHSAYQQDYKNLSVWNLKCTDGEYVLFIAPNGDVQVRSCAHAERLGLPQCRFEAAAKTS